MNGDDLVPAIVITLSAVAMIWDLRTRRIPNLLTFGAAAGAFAYHLAVGGMPALLSAAGGWVVGVALFVPYFLLGGMGAGDVKLLGGLGAWLGPASSFWLCVYSAMAGGVMAIVVAVAHGYGRQAMRNIWMLLMHWRVVGLRPFPELTLEQTRGPRLAYAVPIMAGVLVTLWLK